VQHDLEYQLLATIVRSKLEKILREDLGATYAVTEGKRTFRGGTSRLALRTNVENGKLGAALRHLHDVLAGTSFIEAKDLDAARWGFAIRFDASLSTSGGLPGNTRRRRPRVASDRDALRAGAERLARLSPCVRAERPGRTQVASIANLAFCRNTRQKPSRCTCGTDVAFATDMNASMRRRTSSLVVAIASTTLGVGACDTSGFSVSDSSDSNTPGSCTNCPPSTPVCYRRGYGTTASVPICIAALDFSPCTKAADCPGPDPFCYGLAGGYEAGLCSRPYSAANAGNARVECGPNAFPTLDERTGDNDAVCAPFCPAAGACQTGFACMHGSEGGACVVHCTSDAQCHGTGCNRYSHHCGPVDLALQDDGAACAVDTDCRSGWCHSAQSGRTTTGFLDGLCVGRCIQPADSAYAATTLPASDCPNNEVCAPDHSATGGALLLSECRPRCTTDKDCRTNYVCLHSHRTGSGEPFVDGFCGIRLDPLLGN
jgi:hypothetical protein